MQHLNKNSNAAFFYNNEHANSGIINYQSIINQLLKTSENAFHLYNLF